MIAQLPLVGLVWAALFYRLGSRRASGGRQRRERLWRAQGFYAGLVALALAVEPPLDRLADRLFWAHMLQHLLLQMVAPPLIVLGAPWLPFWRLLPLGTRRRTSRWLLHSPAAAPLRSLARLLAAPPVAWMLFIAAISLSHLPPVFDLALRNTAFHESEHALFVGLGLLFWSRALDSPPSHARVERLRRVVFFLAAAAAEWALALVILAEREPLYSAYARLVPRPEHLSALSDQQFGAGIMLDPFSPLTFALLWAVKVWLQEGDRKRDAVVAG